MHLPSRHVYFDILVLYVQNYTKLHQYISNGEDISELLVIQLQHELNYH